MQPTVLENVPEIAALDREKVWAISRERYTQR
jgi:hypothetical protein